MRRRKNNRFAPRPAVEVKARSWLQLLEPRKPYGFKSIWRLRAPSPGNLRLAHMSSPKAGMRLSQDDDICETGQAYLLQTNP